ncbi:hypothetical protein C8R43DRAFT_1230808 [Mycena crocata]|nr:hypothetical protein C8R43DRAFT_1230808 [Mycena crocata]
MASSTTHQVNLATCLISTQSRVRGSAPATVLHHTERLLRPPIRSDARAISIRPPAESPVSPDSTRRHPARHCASLEPRSAPRIPSAAVNTESHVSKASLRAASTACVVHSYRRQLVPCPLRVERVAFLRAPNRVQVAGSAISDQGEAIPAIPTTCARTTDAALGAISTRFGGVPAIDGRVPFAGGIASFALASCSSGSARGLLHCTAWLAFLRAPNRVHRDLPTSGFRARVNP